MIQVDDCDFDLLLLHNWGLDPDGYPQAKVNRRTQRLHRIIGARMGLDPRLDVDHVDRDKENNRRSNLRQATRSQNRANGGLPVNNDSGYKGVSWDKRVNRWYAQIKVRREKLFLGYFDNAVDAAIAYDEAAVQAFGEFAETNYRLGRYRNGTEFGVNG